MPTVVTMHEAKTNLSKLVARAKAGEEIIIAKRDTPQVRLVPIAPLLKPKRVFGRLAGQFEAPASAFAPLTDEELKDWGY